MLLVQFHAIPRQHVEHDAARVDGVPAHGVLRAGDGHTQPFPRGSRQESGDLPLGIVSVHGHVPNLTDSGLVQAARVVGVALGQVGKVVGIPRRGGDQVHSRPGD